MQNSFRDKWPYDVMFWTSVVAVPASFWLGVEGWNYTLPDPTVRPVQPLPALLIWKIAVLVAWTVIPPILFWIEYFFVYRRGVTTVRATPADFEEFKYGQDVSSRLWLAISTALLILYFGKDIRH